jgi:hypothetical protein
MNAYDDEFAKLYLEALVASYDKWRALPESKREELK